MSIYVNGAEWQSLAILLEELGHRAFYNTVSQPTRERARHGKVHHCKVGA